MLFAFLLMLAVGLALAAAPPAAKDSTTKATTNAMAARPSPSKSTAKSTAKASTSKMGLALASAENLSGTITVVDPAAKELTLVGSNGVPYDFKLTRKTQVDLSTSKIGMNELASETNKQATIHFVPMSDGNFAESIQITAS
ncbi:MAG: hypothetical protein WA623_19510 [Candidatus Sulfotelmatobacter sp.]